MTPQSPLATPASDLKAKAAQQRNKKRQKYRQHVVHSAQNSPSGSPARPTGKSTLDAVDPHPLDEAKNDVVNEEKKSNDETTQVSASNYAGKKKPPMPIDTSSPSISPATTPGPSPSASPSRLALQQRRRKAEKLIKRVAQRNRVMEYGSKTPPRDNTSKPNVENSESPGKEKAENSPLPAEDATKMSNTEDGQAAIPDDETELGNNSNDGVPDDEAKLDATSEPENPTSKVSSSQPAPTVEPEKEEEEANVDPSWDTNKVQFDGRAAADDNSKEAKDGLNMFETDSWAVTSAAFESLPNHPDIEAVAARLMEEEAREKRQSEAGQDQLNADESSGGGVASVGADEGGTPSDPTWDVSNPLFQQKLAEAKALAMKDGLDMFDTASWGKASAAFSDVSLSKMLHADIEAEFVRLMEEDMAKRMHQQNDRQQQTQASPGDVDNLIIYEEKKSGDADETDIHPPPLKDDAIAVENMADVTETTILSVEERAKVFAEPPKPEAKNFERAKIFAEPPKPDAKGFDREAGEEEHVETDYISQASDEEEEEAEERAIVGTDIVPSLSEDQAPAIDPVPTPAQNNGGNDQTRPKVELENLDMVNGASTEAPDSTATESSVAMEFSVSSSLAGEKLLGAGSVGGSSQATGGSVPTRKAPSPIPLHPPPPPPSSERKKRKSKKKKGSKNDSPPIPPQEDKLNEGGEGEVSRLKEKNSSPIDTAKALAIQKALGRAGLKDTGENGEQDGDVQGPPELTRKAFQNEFGAQNVTGGLFLEISHENSSLFGGASKVKTPKSSGDAGRSPSAGAAILGGKLADKIARASSAAADTFEQQFPHIDEQNMSTPKATNSQDDAPKAGPSLFVCAPDNMENIRENFLEGAANAVVSESFLRSPSSKTDHSSDKTHETGMELVGGAFSPWKNAGGFFSDDHSPRAGKSASMEDFKKDEEDNLIWLCKVVLGMDPINATSSEEKCTAMRSLLDDDTKFNIMCQYMADSVNTASTEMCKAKSFEELEDLSTAESLKSLESMDSFVKKRPLLKAMKLSKEGKQLKPNLLAANFVSFTALASKLSNVPSPFGDDNPFLVDLVELSLRRAENGDDADVNSNQEATVQQLIFDHPDGKADVIVDFMHEVCRSSEAQCAMNEFTTDDDEELDSNDAQNTDSEVAKKESSIGEGDQQHLQVVPENHPCPFETAVTKKPSIVVVALSFLGDPVAVCRMKMVNRFCRRIISENEHMIMRDAVRAGGLSMNVRPAFWMWITLQKCGQPTDEKQSSSGEEDFSRNEELLRLEQRGREGKWHNVIQRDVARSFGNMPPHKTGARLRTDSIVRALVTWGKNRIMKRGVRGGGDAVPTPTIDPHDAQRQKDRPQPCQSPPPWEVGGDFDSQRSDLSRTPTDTVSEWGGVSPAGSFASDVESRVLRRKNSGRGDATPAEELALSGNALTDDMKVDLQNKLGFILHALAAEHGDVGYCQGMDYVVAHLLRILQDTIKWKYLRGTLPASIQASRRPHLEDESLDEDPTKLCEEIDQRLLVEETVFSVMDTFFTSYHLRHMYWPELRYLKICCRVFERLIQIKLPVLADHFQHHELNVGLFALGWFQTLFLYLPSMPSATVCHMWDIWLVERSFKIFFRVGTAILFLSQPILLNHELEGMMTYLNTIPDATLLNPDILIACALNIKVTNRMLTELEAEVTGNTV